MKAVYKKFGTFDLTLMASVTNDKYKFVDYVYWMLDAEPFIKNFKMYEQQLIDLRKEMDKEVWMINKIYQLADDLYLRNIDTKTFKEKVDEIYINAEKLFND